MAATARSQKRMVLSLYKTLLRESQKFSSYNYREYALRRIKDAFHSNKSLTDFGLINDQVNYAAKNLGIIRRQVIIGHLYSTGKDKLVIEQPINVEQ